MTRHDDIERLIPWYVNGTLNESEMDLVNEHLAGCAQCTRSVRAEMRFARTMRAAPAGIRQLPDVAVAWQALAHELPRRHNRRGMTVGTVVALLLVLLGGSLLAAGLWQRPAFQTLTTPDTHDGPVVQLMLQPEASDQVLRQVRDGLEGGVLAGPTATGIYRLRLPAGSDGRAHAERLRDLPGVRWAELEAP